MVLHNPNNWHWVNKDAMPWTKQWFQDNAVGVKSEDQGVTVEITKVISMEGDVDVNQRKGKVITIFDVKLVLEYAGTSKGSSTIDSSRSHVTHYYFFSQARLRTTKTSVVPLPFLKSLTILKRTNMLYVMSHRTRRPTKQLTYPASSISTFIQMLPAKRQ